MIFKQDQFQKLSLAARKYMFFVTTIFVAIMIGVGFVIGVILNNYFDLSFGVKIFLIIWIFFWLLFLLITPMIRYHRYRYLIDAEKIVVKEGIFFIKTNFAPIERVHQVAVKSGPIDRLYGLSKVVATTAGGTISINFIEKEKAEEIAENLNVKIRSILKLQGISLEDLSKNNH